VDIVADTVVLVGLLVWGVPIPFCFMAAVLFMALVHGYDFNFLLPVGFYKLNSIVLLAVPFFILLGELLSTTGIGKRLVEFANALLGRVRGGLGAVSVVSCALVGAIAGTCSAAVAAVGSIMIPRLQENGYPKGYSSALVTCASILGQLIPPSVPMIFFAWATFQPVGPCWLATIVPGILLVIIYSFINYMFCRKMPSVKVEPPTSRRTWVMGVGHASYRAAIAILIPLAVLGTIWGGIATPTEAAAIGLVVSILIGFVVYRSIKLGEFRNSLVTAGTTTGVIILMVYFVMILSRIYTMENVPQRLIVLLTGISDNKYVILLMVNLFLIIIGMLMDDFSGTLLAAPLLFPLMTAIGVHPFHFAAIMGTNLGLGNMTPPCAPILYLGARIGGVTIDKMLKPTTIYLLLGSLPVVLITTYFPPLALTLPHLLSPNLVPTIWG